MAVHPPSTTTFKPVMYEEASEAIKVITFAISSGSPSLLRGTLF